MNHTRYIPNKFAFRALLPGLARSHKFDMACDTGIKTYLVFR